MTDKAVDNRPCGPESFSASKPEEDTDDDKVSWCDLCYDESEQKIKVDGFCSECNSFLCKPCLDAHKKSPASRNHVITRGSRMPKSQADKPVKYPNCMKHIGMIHNQFCLDHSEMICSRCIDSAHSHCNTKAIDDLSRDLSSKDVKVLKLHVKSIHSSVVTTKSVFENNITDVEMQGKRIVKEIHSIRDKVIAKTEKLCSDMVSRVTKICNQKASTMSQQLLMLSDLNECFIHTISNLDKAANMQFGPNTFVRVQDIVVSARKFETDVDTMKTDLKKAEISFIVNPEIESFISANNQLGEVTERFSEFGTLKTTPKLTFPPLPEAAATRKMKGQVKDISRIRPSKLATLNVKTGEDNDDSKVEGMDATSKGILIISDLKNRKVKLFSSKYKFLSALSLPGKSYDVAVLDDSTAIVSIDQEKHIILDITYPSEIHAYKTGAFGYFVTAMTTWEGNLVVVRWNEPRCVKMVTLEGQELWTAMHDNSGQQLFKTPYSVVGTTINGQPIILATDWGKDALILLDARNGDFVKKIDLKGLSPRGITVDPSRNIYVCCSKTADIYVWSADLKEHRQILSRSSLQPDPVDILYNSAAGELLVSYRTSAQIDRFQL